LISKQAKEHEGNFICYLIKLNMEIYKMNRKGELKSGTVILVVALLLGAYFLNVGGVKDLLAGSGGTITPTPSGVVNDCPSSGLTEWTINAQEALAATATNANVTYYIYDGASLIKEGDTGSDGTASIDLACGVGKTYTALVLNDKATTGFYPQTVTIDASKPTITSNLKVYEFGQVNLASIVSSSSPTGNGSISAGTGKNCGFTLTFSENESASAYNKPILMCLVNTTAVTDMTMDGVVEVNSKKPNRISTPGGHQYYAFEYPQLLKSTDAAVKVSGQLQFTSSATVDDNAAKNNMSCIIVDQTVFKKAEYKTLSLNDGFIEAAENEDTIASIGAPDSNRQTLYFNGAYC
jgi:hypothetical protein